jgi:chemotaxis response regulator CheB
MRVILIEPDPEWRGQIVQWLSEAQIDCLATSTASSAFAKIAEEPCLGLIAQENLLTFGLSPATLQQAPLLVLCDGMLPTHLPKGIHALHHPRCGEPGFSKQLAQVVQNWRILLEHQKVENEKELENAKTIPSVSEEPPKGVPNPITSNPGTHTGDPIKISDKIPEVLLVGSSTGGPDALALFLNSLPKLGQPLLIVQHQPEKLAETLAEQLQETCDYPVLVAHHQQRAENGCVYIAPGGTHMILRRSQSGSLWIELVSSPPVNFCRPSVDILFGSASIVCKNRIRAVVLTGMGEDGLVGAQQIHGSGGRIATQNESTCVVYGMPKAVFDAGISEKQGSPSQLASWIALGI